MHELIDLCDEVQLLLLGLSVTHTLRLESSEVTRRTVPLCCVAEIEDHDEESRNTLLDCSAPPRMLRSDLVSDGEDAPGLRRASVPCFDRNLLEAFGAWAA